MRQKSNIARMVVAFATASISFPAGAQDNSAAGLKAAPEEVYVGRSLRKTRVKPAAFCKTAPANFDPVIEDTYEFRSIELNDKGQIKQANVASIGDLKACYGRKSNSTTLDFFAEGTLNSVNFQGNGECYKMINAPVDGSSAYSCYMVLSKLPALYVGGLLTTNSFNSKTVIGEITDPPGYIQPSIATIRLWKNQ
jgi:hypothetical protein